jgi:hypothetical protein
MDAGGNFYVIAKERSGQHLQIQSCGSSPPHHRALGDPGETHGRKPSRPRRRRQRLHDGGGTWRAWGSDRAKSHRHAFDCAGFGVRAAGRWSLYQGPRDQHGHRRRRHRHIHPHLLRRPRQLRRRLRPAPRQMSTAEKAAGDPLPVRGLGRQRRRPAAIADQPPLLG